MAYNSEYFGIEVKDADRAYLQPRTDWDKAIKSFDLNIGRSAALLFGNNVVSGFGITTGTLMITLAAGIAFANGVYVKNTAPQEYTLPGAIGDGTYKIYITANSQEDGTYTIAYTAGSVPAGGVYLYDITTVSAIITASSDKRTYVANKLKQKSVLTKTATYTVLPTDEIFLCNATSGAVTLNLPSAALLSGKEYEIKKIDSSGNTVIIEGYGSETIDGATNKTLSSQYASVKIVSDGSNWYVF